MPAMRRISAHSSSVSGQIVRRVFFRNLIFFSVLAWRSSANLTCRGSVSIARKHNLRARVLLIAQKTGNSRVVG